MVPLKSWEIINFFEWVKENDVTGCEIGKLRKTICAAKHNPDLIDNITPIIKKYIEKNNLSFAPWQISESIMSHLYYLKDEEQSAKIKDSLLNDEKIINVTRPKNAALDIIFEEDIMESCDRYKNPNIYKCMIFPFKNDDTLKKLVKSHYEVLNNESADCFDIFYSKKELKASGYETKDKISKLNIPVDSLPCVAIWKDKVENATIIPISGINEDGLFQLLIYIIGFLKHNKNIPLNYCRKYFIKKVDIIKNNNEYRKSKKESISHEFLWKILIPLTTGILGALIGGLFTLLIQNALSN